MNETCYCQTELGKTEKSHWPAFPDFQGSFKNTGIAKAGPAIAKPNMITMLPVIVKLVITKPKKIAIAVTQISTGVKHPLRS